MDKSTEIYNSIDMRYCFVRQVALSNLDLFINTPIYTVLLQRNEIAQSLLDTWDEEVYAMYRLLDRRIFDFFCIQLHSSSI